MKNEQIIKKAIEKAIKNGWYIGDRKVRGAEEDEGKIGIWISNDFKCDIVQSKFYLIFSHDFAKAFWGEFEIEYFNREYKAISEEEYKRLGEDLAGSKVVNYGWRYYQHRMLSEIQEGKDPIKYLEKFL